MPPIVLNKPISKGLMVLTAHPEGCRALVEQQVVRAKNAFPEPLTNAKGKTALVLGNTSFGYGSSTAIALRRAGFDQIIGNGFEKAPLFRGDQLRRASPGWYLTHALHDLDPGFKTYLADAFADATRDRIISDLKKADKKIDLVLYSVAAPNRTHLGETWRSSLGVLGEPLEALGLNYPKGEFAPTIVKPSTQLQAEHTRRVMGGDDLNMWVSGLLYSDLLSEGAIVAALSYIGPEFKPLRRMYWEGTMGWAKQHIDATTKSLDERLERKIGGKALTVMNPAVVTTASVAFPAMLKYLAAYLGVVAGGVGVYDDPLDVGINFANALYGDGEPWQNVIDDEGRLRLDAHELDDQVQAAIRAEWDAAQAGPAIGAMKAGFERFTSEFLKLYGWGVRDVDYDAPYEFNVPLTPEMRVFNLIANDAKPSSKPTTPQVTKEAEQQAGAAAVDNFYKTILNRIEPGVTKLGDSFYVQAKFDADQSKAYAKLTGNRAEIAAGQVPPEMVFNAAFPAIIEAIKDVLRSSPHKTILHMTQASSGETMAIGAETPIRASVSKLVGKEGGKRIVKLNVDVLDSKGAVTGSAATSLIMGVPLSSKAGKKVDPATLGQLVKTVTITPEMIDDFATVTGDFNPVHANDEAAQSLGLKRRVAHGMLVLALAKGALQESAAAGAEAGSASTSSKFSGFVYAGDDIRFYVQDLADGAGQEIVALNQSDEPVLKLKVG